MNRNSCRSRNLEFHHVYCDESIFFLFLHNNHNISFIIWKWDKKLSQWSRFIFGTSSKSSTVYRRQIDFVRFVLIKSILAKPLPGSKTMKLLLKISKRNNNVIWGIWPYHTTFCYNMSILHGSVNHMLKLRLDRKQNSNNMNIPAIPWLSCVLVAPHPETNSIYLELLKSTCQKKVYHVEDSFIECINIRPFIL